MANPCLATRSFGGPKVQSPLPALRKVRDRIRQSRFRLYSKEVAPTIEWLDQKGDRTGWVFNRFLSKLPALPLRHSVSTRLLPWAFPMPDTLPVYAACFMLPLITFSRGRVGLREFTGRDKFRLQAVRLSRDRSRLYSPGLTAMSGQYRLEL